MTVFCVFGLESMTSRRRILSLLPGTRQRQRLTVSAGNRWERFSGTIMTGSWHLRWNAAHISWRILIGPSETDGFMSIISR